MVTIHSIKRSAKIVIIGAGSIGCWVGAALIHAGRNVAFLGKDKVIAEVAANGLRITDHQGRDLWLPAESVDICSDERILCNADIVIIAVKSLATSVAAQSILKYAPKHATILSFQNGIRNAERIREIVGTAADVRAVMVPFNVVWSSAGHFHRGVGGELVVQKGTTDLNDILTVDGLVTKTSSDIEAVLWGKILLNLNNALNALSNRPLKAQLNQRGWRLILAQCQKEALRAMKAAGITPHSELPLPLQWMPIILQLPNVLFKKVAAKMLEIDDNARSSMWEDLVRGRQTEIADLQGEIVALANQHNVPSPVNQRVLDAVRQAEQNKSGSPGILPFSSEKVDI